MKKKNLEKAIILGLILSTGIYGTAWAEDYSKTNSPYNTSITDADNTVTGDVVFELDNKALITNSGKDITVIGKDENSSLSITTNGTTILNTTNGNTTIGIDGDINLTSVYFNKENEKAYAIHSQVGTTEIISKNGDITIDISNAKPTNPNDKVKFTYLSALSTSDEGESNIRIDAAGTVTIKAETVGSSNVKAIDSQIIFNNKDNSINISGSNVNIIANDGGHQGNSTGIDLVHYGLGDSIGNNVIKITGTGLDKNGDVFKGDENADPIENYLNNTYNNTISTIGLGIHINAKEPVGETKVKSLVEITSENASNVINADYAAINTVGGNIKLNAANGINYISSKKEDKSSRHMIELKGTNLLMNARENYVIAVEGFEGGGIHGTMNELTPNNYYETVLTATQGNNYIQSGNLSAVNAENGYNINLTAENGNNILNVVYVKESLYSKGSAIETNGGNVSLIAKSNDKTGLTGNNILVKNNQNKAIEAKEAEDTEKKGIVNLYADVENQVNGTVKANANSEVNITGKSNTITASNYVVTADASTKSDADKAADIIITARESENGINNITSTSTYGKSYTVYATEGGNIELNGTSKITSNAWEYNNNKAGEYLTNNNGAALIAGTYNWSGTDVTVNDEDYSTINLNYGNGSMITGEIIAGYAGAINIIDQSSGSGAVGISTMAEGQDTSAAGNSLTIMGNALAANGGKINLELGKGSVWQGRADDYQDAADENWAQAHLGEFNAVFSNDVQAEGTVNVALNDGATWDVMGQSWLTKLGGNDGVIDMRNTEGDDSRTSHAVHIGDLEGNHTFVMDLDTEHSVSDMLFIKGQASGEQKLWINSINGLENLDDGDSLRFATVNSAGLTFSGDYNFGSYENAKNGIMLADNGVMDNAFIIKSEEYDVNDSKNENIGYNGGTEFDEVKPGDEYVDGNYASGINWYLEREKAEDKTSDAGKTIINMSKVNYNNAIYMDRLNKRLGEARYISPEDEQGMWVRIRHDRIGKDDAFRSQNTMYEMGYDVKQDCDNGERRVGFAIDYMDGKAEYTGIAGDGDVKRYGLWLYDTWLGDKGHYTDYVLKWGHLENDFDIMARTTGEKITGDYSNNVFSASAEYGKKNDMGGGWYFEPQAQLQFARVTGADYVTSQDTKVSLDGINSLIGRAGFRLGRDLNENSTVYFKADLLHEFLGDQDITATDITGTLREEYENEGTWYDIGFGFATALGNNSYAFMDFEKSFGNDNDETYQINAGVRWTF